MAFLKDITKNVFGDSVVFENAYHIVSKIEGDKNHLTFKIIAYRDETKRHELFDTLYTFKPSQDEDAIRWDKQAYEYLKTLDEYKDAIDV